MSLSSWPCSDLCPRAQAPVISTTSVTVRVMSANLTSGNYQRYEAPGLRIFQGLKPDVVAIQEFNYASTNGAGVNTQNAFREMLDNSFGTNFVYFRETGAGYTIPNGIISRWPILEAGSWEDIDTGVNDRGFAWARIDLPGAAGLYLVSVHLKASSSDAARRTAEAAQLTSLIQSNFPAGALIIAAGDMNIDSPAEGALATFKTYLSDSPVPTDAGGDADTNAGRNERYDYLLPSFLLTNRQVATVIGSKSFDNGLVFDSRVYSPLAEVRPVLSSDSAATGMQHMGVVKDFRLSYTVTNYVAVPPPLVRILSTNVLCWTGLSNLTYTVQNSTTLTNWTFAGTASSSATNYFFTNSQPLADHRFYRVIWP